MTKLQFPKDFLWGTSTAAAQIETASEHNWKGVQSNDGFVFDRTTEHEKRRMEDVEYITQFGTVYRCGVDWARLQSSAFADFDMDVVKEYQDFFQALNDRGMKIMFVIHHFTNPLWFEKENSWLNEDNIPAFVNYAEQCIQHFGNYVYTWNTFNEPNVYAINSWLMGAFPPFQQNFFKFRRALKQMGRAHDIVYYILKERTPDKKVGISLNTVWFDAKNPLGWLPAKFAEYWFFRKTVSYFKNLDYWGISYYAYIPLNPFPITFIDNPDKVRELGVPHDKMWLYRPEGIARFIRKINKWFPDKEIIITENGICTDFDDERIASIKDYLKICHDLIQEGVPLKGYIHWTTFDNHEWNLGPTYRFGLVSVNMVTMERNMTEAGRFYAKVAKTNEINI